MTTTATPRPQPGFVPTPRATLAPRPPAPAPGQRGAPAVDVRDFSFSYGTRQVLRDLSFSIERKSVTAIIGPSGCGKSTFLRSINRLNDLIPGVRHGGDILVEGMSVFSSSTDLVALRQRVGMVFQRPNPFPKSMFDNVAYGPALNRLVARRDLPDLVERCLRQAALWDEVKDRLDESGDRPVGRPAAAALHRAGARQSARGAADGRAVLGARPDRDPEGGGADLRAQEGLHDRDRHA